MRRILPKRCRTFQTWWFLRILQPCNCGKLSMSTKEETALPSTRKRSVGSRSFEKQASFLEFKCRIMNGNSSIAVCGTPQGEDMQKGSTESDYTVTIGLGKCNDLKLTTNSLVCALPEVEPETLENNARTDGGLYVNVSEIPTQTYLFLHMSVFVSLFLGSFVFCSRSCFLFPFHHLKYMPCFTTINLQMMIGNHNEFIGYLKYKKDGDVLKWLKWALTGAGGALLVTLATVAAVCSWRRRQSAERLQNEQYMDLQENPDLESHRTGQPHGPTGKRTVLWEGAGQNEIGRVGRNPTDTNDTGYMEFVQHHEGLHESHRVRQHDTGYLQPTQQVGPTDRPRPGVYIAPMYTWLLDDKDKRATEFYNYWRSDQRPSFGQR